MLRNSVAAAVIVMCMRPRAMPLAMITMRKSTHGLPFFPAPLRAAGAPLSKGNSWD